MPALITTDDRALFATSYSTATIDTDVSESGLWTRRQAPEASTVLRIEGAWLLSDRWQAGSSIPVVQRSRSGDGSQGLGDVAINLGYEYLPDWDYNPWRPKGVGFLQLTLPTGRSIYEADQAQQLDSRGRGFWALGVGSSLTKTIRSWDFLALTEVHRAFEKSVRSSQAQGSITVEPGWGGSLELGSGWNWRDWRFGGAITWMYEDPVDVSGALSSRGSVQRYATGALSAGYMWSTEWSGALTYADQAVFGDPLNTTLGRSVAVLIQHRWPR